MIQTITLPGTEAVLKVQARDVQGYHVNIFLSGEASSGKTTACKQLAKALDRKWYFNGRDQYAA